MNAIASKMKSIAVIAMMLLSIGVGNAWGDKLCQSSYTGTIGALGSKTVYVSVGTIGTNMYRIVFESDFAMTGSLTYVNTSYNNNLCLDATTKTILNDGKLIYFDIYSTTAPTFKNGIQVSYGGGGYTLSGTAVNLVDWSQTTAECATLAGDDCTGWSTEASTGGASFTKGYVYELGSDESGNVSISVKFLDDPTGASTAELYMLNESGGELGGFTAMTWSSGTKTASHTLTGQSGTIYFKVRVPYTGNVFVTKKFSVTVGTTCATGGGSGGGEESSCDTKHFYYVKLGTTTYANVYMWKAGGSSENTSWPGEAMVLATDFSSLIADYIYEVTYDGKDFDKVIFNTNGDASKTSDLDIQNCKFYLDGSWYNSIEAVEAKMVYFVNTSNWADANVKANIWKNGGGVLGSSELMTYTGATTNSSHKVFFYYHTNLSSYDKIQFHNNGSNYSGVQTLEIGNYFNYADDQWYTSTKYLNFSNSGWTLNPFVWSDLTSTVQTTKITISNAASDYEFNIKSAGASYYYNHGKMTNSNCTDWKFNENSSQNCWIDPDVAGDYVFKYDFAENKLSVVYPPSMTSATLYLKTHNSATLTVASTRGTKYKVTNSDGSVEYTVSNGGVADGNGHITVTGLTPGTQYSFKVYALDDNDTESANYSSVSAFYTLPVMGRATFNTRTYNSITLEVTGTGASQYRVVNTSPAVDQTITPSDGKITVTSLSPNTSYTFTVTAKNAGGDASDNSVVMSAIYTTPQMTTATLDSKTQTTVVLNVASNGGATYKVTNPAGDEYTLSSSTPTNGKITVTGLSANTEYTLRVYAISSSSSLVSSNYIDVTTITYPNVNSGPSGYYDCQVLAVHTSGDEYNPKGISNAGWDGTNATFTEFSDGSEKKACHINSGTSYYYGVLIGNSLTNHDVSNYKKLHIEFWSAESRTFNFHILARDGENANKDGIAISITTSAGSWVTRDIDITNSSIVGENVTNNNTRIYGFKVDFFSGNTSKELIIANAYFYTPDVCESMKCHGSGSAGSGLTINTAEVFDTGESYWTKAYMYNSKLHIDAKFTSASSVSAVTAYVQFVNLDGGILQFGPMTNNADSFSIEVTPSDVKDAYRYDGIARYSVKFELSVSPKIRQTDYHYYDFTNSECAPDYFDIYHYDDATGSQRTSYAGGIILQPIRYFRHFEHTDWCAITFPFSVSKVVVDEGGTEYDLYPRFNNGSSDVEGYYWLKTFDNWNSTPVAISEFQSAWKQLTVSTASSEDAVLAGLVKPAKDVPYVIAFPDGSYYGTNWVIFYGDAGQTIASSEDSGCGTSFSGDGETVKLQRNSMMQPTSSKTNIYMLEEGHNYYSRQTQAIPAFESYVIGTATVKEKYRVLRMDNVSTPETPTDIDALPTTECRGAIYSLSGMRIAAFADRDAMEQLLSGLSAGVYVVRAGAVINKVVVQ